MLDEHEVIAEFDDEIIRLSRRSQRVPGLLPDDVAQEMRAALLKAIRTYDEDSGLSIGQYWWAVWTRAKANLLKAHFAKKRPELIPTDDADLSNLVDELWPLLPADFGRVDIPCPTTDETDNRCWKMLAAGFTGKEIRTILQISTRRWYAMIEVWKTNETHTLLGA